MADLTYPEQGDIWLNNDKLTLKYHLDGKNRTVVPQDWFMAGEAITASKVVSIADSTWQPTATGKLFHTDSANVEKTVGIALNGGAIGDWIEVQRAGLYTYASNVFTTDQIGKIAYVSIAPDGDITTDLYSAVLLGNNLIEIGQVIALNQIMISIEGDGRGPMDFSEFEYIVGEAMDYSSGTPFLLCQKADGKVYKASKKKSDLSVGIDRYNVVGFLAGIIAGDTALADGDKVIVRRTGLVEGFTGLTAGSPVFASGDETALSFGGVTQNIAEIDTYNDKYIYVGVAYQSDAVIANINPPVDMLSAAAIGTIKLSENNYADSGHLLMDGSEYLIATYPELYAVIGDTFGVSTEPGVKFKLANLNVAIDYYYQIKAKYFNELAPFYYTPTYQVEFPDDGTWHTYDGESFEVDIGSFTMASSDDFKQLHVKLFAKKNDNVIEVPDLFAFNDGVSEKKYGYTIGRGLSNAALAITIANDGLAYNDATSVIPLDGTWELKVIVQKNERFNQFRDSNADAHLQTLWNNMNSPNDFVEYEPLTASKSYGQVSTNYSVTIDSAIITTVDIHFGCSNVGKTFRLSNKGTANCNLVTSGTNTVILPPNSSVEYMWDGTDWQIFNSIMYASIWNPLRTYKQYEPIFYEGVPYRSKINNNTNMVPSTSLNEWEVTGGGGVTINGISNINAVAGKVIALDPATSNFVLATNNSATVHTAVGFAKSSLSIGVDGQLLGNGSVVKGFVGLTPGASVYLGHDGAFFTDPSLVVQGEYRQHLGTCLNTTDILVDIEEPEFSYDVFRENIQTINATYTVGTVPVPKNALTAGPVTIADGVVITIEDGSNWIIV